MSISGSIANLAPRENFPEVGTFPPPYKNSNNDAKEINVKLDKIIELLEAILKNVQNN